MSMSRIDQSFGRGSSSSCRAKRNPVNVTGTVASQTITPQARIHGVYPSASATSPANARANPTYPARSAQTDILQTRERCNSCGSSTRESYARHGRTTYVVSRSPSRLDQRPGITADAVPEQQRQRPWLLRAPRRVRADGLASARDDRGAPEGGDGAVLRCRRVDGAGGGDGSGGVAGAASALFRADERDHRVARGFGGEVHR